MNNKNVQNNQNDRLNQEKGISLSDLSINAPYISPTPGQIPIIASSPFTHYKKVVSTSENDNRPEVTQEEVEDVEKCGFNVAMEAVGEYVTAIEAYLNLFKETKIGFMPYSPFLNNPTTYKGFINYFLNNKRLVGWDYKDEPLFSELESIQTQYKKLRTADPNRIFYINLVGSAEKKYVGDYGDESKDEVYKNYVNKIQDMFHPAVWSYDLYPISVNASGDISVETNRFYKDFEVFSAISAKTGRPFWAFCQSQAFYNIEKTWGRPAPKEEYLRYEAFSALAYGAQGIVYWTYGQRLNNKSEIYTTALVGVLEDGTIGRTKYWDYAYVVNWEIKKYTSVFLGCTLIKAQHFGAVYIAQTLVDFGPLSLADSKDDGALITHIRNGNTNYIVIVNHSPLSTSRITLQFKPNSRIAIWGPKTFTNDILNTSLETAPTDVMHINLPAGSYLIIPFK